MLKKDQEKAQSPGQLTAKRFLRNRLAVVGLCILFVMFLFSFVGGWLSPYGQDQVFYKEELQQKEVAAVSENDSFRFLAAPGQAFGTVLQAQLLLVLGKQDHLTYAGVTYTIVPAGTALYEIYGDTLLGIAAKDMLTPSYDFPLTYQALLAYANGEAAFSVGAQAYTLDGGRILQDGREIAYISRLVFGGSVFSGAFRAAAEQAIFQRQDSFSYEEDGALRQFSLYYDSANKLWSIREQLATRVWDAYAPPSKTHLLGTDKNGMDVLTRLMYGGRVSLVIGFVVVLISGVLGVLFGGISGYFGGWVDHLVMRTVDVFYCIPSTPLLIILGATMDALRVEPRFRMLLLMLVLGFLGWPGIARLVRGQILSLREQEFMTAAEALGLPAGRRIFKHLIPNVIPQLIVVCTMGLGSTILTEATLSFLGLGVKFPFASWGNIMNDVSNAFVLTNYWFVWIPAGVCLVLSVLGFNFAGDGLRDAFDPKMKR